MAKYCLAALSLSKIILFYVNFILNGNDNVNVNLFIEHELHTDF